MRENLQKFANTYLSQEAANLLNEIYLCDNRELELIKIVLQTETNKYLKGLSNNK